MENFTVDFFRFDNGDCPLREYLDGIDMKLRAKIIRTKWKHAWYAIFRAFNRWHI